MTVEIRDETSHDVGAIHDVTELAFRDVPYAAGTEAEIVDRLRAAGALLVSLVATSNDEIVGHVAFSPAQASDSTHPWFALGPVSVVPAFQRQGVGSALIEKGLATIKERGALGCVLVGDPEYYRRFGFEPSPENSPREDFAAYFMIYRFSSVAPSGALTFHDAFGVDA